MQDQVGLDLDGFPLNHVFPDDYGLEGEDEVDIYGEPLFEDEVANQAARVKPKRKRRWTKAYTAVEDKLLCECWRDIGKDPKVGAKQKTSTFGFVSIVIQQECNKFFATYESIKAHPESGVDMQDMAFQALEAFKVQHEGNRGGCWGGRKSTAAGKTNSKKEEKRDAVSIALIATVEGMVTKKESREEQRRQDKEEQMNAFMEIQRRRLEMEAEKQAKTLEIKAANAKTKAK
ncbi:Lectin-domain containing receptor kinase A4.3 [Hordeum vulgare]|nr:Lectin-domain containing receptor kinase A4.3 [Hordeum vulgare]